MRHIMKCTGCGSYTMKEACNCGGKTERAKPAKFSPEDRYAAYRRMAKRELENKV